MGRGVSSGRTDSAAKLAESMFDELKLDDLEADQGESTFNMLQATAEVFEQQLYLRDTRSIEIVSSGNEPQPDELDDQILEVTA